MTATHEITTTTTSTATGEGTAATAVATHNTVVSPDDIDTFTQRMLETLNQGALSLAVSVGHRTGLFDAMAALPPSSSSDIAAAAGLNERYVREWLGAVVTGRVVVYEAATGRYHLPAAHAAALTREAVPNNIAAFAQYIALLGSVEDRIVGCFRDGGGVPYAEFPRFQEIMSEDSGQTVIPALFDEILPLADGLVEELQQGIDVLDIGCGAGRALHALAARFPASRFTGYDISAEGVACATAEAARLGLTNVTFAVKDVADLGVANRFDLVTAFDAIHDQVDPGAVLRGVFNALKPSGTLLMQDIAASSYLENNTDHPIATWLYTLSCFHCMAVSLAEGGAGLGTMWGHELAVAMLGEAGFTDIRVERLPHDFQNSYFVARKTVAETPTAGSNGTTGIRTATVDDLPEIGEILGHAFEREPLVDWFVRRDARRKEAITRHFREVTRFAHIVYGETFITEDGSGVLVCLPPNPKPAGPFPELETTFDWVVGPTGRRNLNLVGELVESRRPAEPHRYLFALGVRPERQGEGIGSALLRVATARCDHEGVGAYLETASEANVRLYERHGFTTRGEVKLPDGPVVSLMWRDPC